MKFIEKKYDAYLILFEFNIRGKICGLPGNIKKKGNTGTKTKMLMSFKE